MNTETIDKLYLELSQVTSARTSRETSLYHALVNMVRYVEGDISPLIDKEHFKKRALSTAKFLIEKEKQEENW